MTGRATVTITVCADDGTEVISKMITPTLDGLIVPLGDGDGWKFAHGRRAENFRDEIQTIAGWGAVLAGRVNQEKMS